MLNNKTWPSRIGHRSERRLFNSGPYFGAARCQGSDNHLDGCKAWPKDITERQIRDEVDYWADRGIRSVKIKLASPEQMRIRFWVEGTLRVKRSPRGFCSTFEPARKS